MSLQPRHCTAKALLQGLVWIIVSAVLHSGPAVLAQRATEEVESGVSFRIRGVPNVIDVGGPAQPQCQPPCEPPKVCQCTCDRQDCEPEESAEDCAPCHCDCL